MKLLNTPRRMSSEKILYDIMVPQGYLAKARLVVVLFAKFSKQTSCK